MAGWKKSQGVDQEKAESVEKGVQGSGSSDLENLKSGLKSVWNAVTGQSSGAEAGEYDESKLSGGQRKNKQRVGGRD